MSGHGAALCRAVIFGLSRADAVREYLASIGQKGGKAKVKKGTAALTKAQRVAQGRAGAAARWGKKESK